MSFLKRRMYAPHGLLLLWKAEVLNIELRKIVELCSPGTALWRKVLEPLSFYVFSFEWRLRNDRPGNRQDVPSEQILASIPLGKLTIDDTQRLAFDYAYLKDLSRNMDPLSLYRINLLFQNIWQLYCREAETIKQEQEKKHDPLMEKAMRMIREKAYGIFSMKHLSTELGLNAVQFSRRFSAATGMTPTDFLCTLRLDKARILLAKTQLTHAEIAVQCGYDNGLYLSRIFSKKMKVSPSQYRRDHRI